MTDSELFITYGPDNFEHSSEYLEDLRKFREYKDSKKAARNARTAKKSTQRIKPQSPTRTFDSWSSVPPEYKTKQQWRRAGRRVTNGESPTARVVYPKLVEGHLSATTDLIVLHQTDGLTVISDGETNLFHHDQTAKYKATSRTLAYWEFEKIFFECSRKDSWIRRTGWNGEELDEWVTESEEELATKFHERNLLSRDLIHQHINQAQIIGIKGGELTRFVVIDLDFHGRDLSVFEQQAEVLLDRFHGRGTWHYQVRRHDVSGLQMICVFRKPQNLEVVRSEFRRHLIELDGQHPELATKAKTAGMKSLADLEIYPATDNGVRLPLCRDREMLLDEPMPLVVNRKKQVQDVEKYIHWLNDPNRQYMPKELILDYLHYFSWEDRQTPRSQLSPKPKQSRSGKNSGWKGNLPKWLYEFWIEGDANGRSLNEHIAVLSRLAAIHGYSESEIADRINDMISGLPACAHSCSSRLLHREYRKIERVVRTTAQYASDDNGHQPDPESSTEILEAVLNKWTDFDPLDVSTWRTPGKSTEIVPNWTDDQKKRLIAFFRKPLFVKDPDLIVRFLNAIVNLTIRKEREESGWGKEYLLKWMKSQFPQIKCAKDEKRQRILRLLEEEGIIQAVARGRAGCYATRWALGPVAKRAIGEKAEEISRSSDDLPRCNKRTSIYYGSLFSELDTIEFETCLQERREFGENPVISASETS